VTLSISGSKFIIMIARIWQGYTSHANATFYDEMLRHEIFSGIQDKKINGFIKIQLLKRELNNETEFMTVMWFENLEAVKEFAGHDYEKAVIYPDAIPLLIRYDQRSAHYEVVI
jgi:heme-degrading monooxygenase HmoA